MFAFKSSVSLQMDLNASLAVKGKASTLAAANLESAIECGHTSPYSII